VLSHLTARGFRNLQPLDLEPAAGTHLLLGGNGAGKTSLLEAIYVLGTTRSFRAGQIVDCVAHGASELAAVLAEVGEVREISAAAAAVAASPPPAAGAAPSGPTATEVLFGVGGRGGAASAGVAAASAAAESAATAATAGQAGLRLAEIELRYQPSPPQGLEGPAAIAAVLDRAVERERRRQQPLLGPQRVELEILWGGHELRRVASAGERKALSLLLLAAHGRVIEAAGRRPVYLLDDADAELAPASVAAVWSVFARRVAATGGQLLASSNRPQVWLTLDVDTLWEMERGRLKRL